MLPDRVSNPGPLTYESGTIVKYCYHWWTFYGRLNSCSEHINSALTTTNFSSAYFQKMYSHIENSKTRKQTV